MEWKVDKKIVKGKKFPVKADRTIIKFRKTMFQNHEKNYCEQQRQSFN